MHHRLVAYALSFGLALSASACSYGIVQDASNQAFIGGATVSFQKPVLTGTSTTNVFPTLGTPVVARTWASTDPGVGGGTGAYYLNPYGTLRFGENRVLFVDGTWQRVVVSKSGYDTRRFYRNHVYVPCDVPQAQGPYSAGPYPYVGANSGPFVTAAVTYCREDSFALNRNTTNYIKDPDMIVDPRTLNDREVSTSCDGFASRCLRVSVGTANVGDGDLWIRGQQGQAGVTQRRFRRDGAVGSIVNTPLPNAVFEFHATHDHIHLQNWTNLRLRQYNTSCSTEDTAARCPLVGNPGRKLSFCLTETATFDSSYVPNPNRASACTVSATGQINQGIGAGREDTYGKWLPGQLLGIDNVPPGSYWLEVEVNPADAFGNRTILESDYNNNITRTVITL